MSPRRFPSLLALFLGALLATAALFLSFRPREAPPEGNSAPNDSLTTQEYLRIETEHRRLDDSTWSPEMVALGYDRIIATAWDMLRQGSNAFSTLVRLPCSRIHVPTLSTNSPLRDRITRAIGSLPAVMLDSAAIASAFRRWESDGWKLEQTEWRQIGFSPAAPPSPASSRVRFSFHAANPAHSPPSRRILRGEAEIRWSGPPGPSQEPPGFEARIDSIEMLDRSGPTPFRRVVETDIEPPQATPMIDPVLVRDLDGDGFSEIVFLGKNAVWKNLAGRRFETSVLCPTWSSVLLAGVFADTDGDGADDLVAFDHQGLLVFPGEQSLSFSRPPARTPFALRLKNPFAVSAGDMDRDGDLDLWVCQYKLPYREGQMPTPYYDANDGFPAYVLRNEGQGRFTDVTESCGLGRKRFRRAYSGSWADLDGDGAPELIVVSDFAGLDVFHNDGNGRFTDVTAAWAPGAKGFGMAHALADFDADGRQDLLMVGMDSPTAQRLEGMGLGRADFPAHQQHRAPMSYGTRLLWGAPGPGFATDDRSRAVAQTGWAWGPACIDINGDGALDLFIANGHSSRESASDYDSQFWRHDIYAASSAHNPAWDLWFNATARRLYGAGYSYGGWEKNRLYLNQGAGVFVECAYLYGLSDELDCRNAVAEDLDRDGRPDLLVTTFETWPRPRQRLLLYRNERPMSQAWVGVTLAPSPGGLSAIGATLRVSAATGRPQTRQVITGDSYRAQPSLSFLFGLDPAAAEVSIQVDWPGGRRQRIDHAAPGRYHRIGPPLK